MAKMAKKRKMNSETLNALLASISHWAIVASNPADALVGPDECGLCQRFHSDQPNSINQSEDTCCRGCPIFLKTGKTGCDRTPYTNFRSGARDAKSVAVKELQFLVSLLPR